MSSKEVATLSSSSPSGHSPRNDDVPALSILWHPDISRIGAMFSFADVAEGQSVLVSRNSPKFAHPAKESDSLADPYLSRNPCLQIMRTANGLDLVPDDSQGKVQLDGKPRDRRVEISSSELSRFPVITLARRIVLCAHTTASATPAPLLDDLGLLGFSDRMLAVREAILTAAGVDVPILIRGETGTGKELTARAIAKASSRAQKPFVAINMGALQSSTALAELFGHARGAFTGANEDDGILFLDEIGFASPEVQTALLRVLETGEMRPLGSRSARRVNVRVFAATDARLEERVKAGDFLKPLFHRLSAFPVTLPPLHERRQDIGLLFCHFLRRILKETDDVSKLESAADAKHPWLSGDIMTAMALASWPGNVRQLNNFAVQLALTNRGVAQAQLNPTLLASLAEPVN
jgi:two-component system nitrogen regulation response regulator GlnG